MADGCWVNHSAMSFSGQASDFTVFVQLILQADNQEIEPLLYWSAV